MFATVERMAAVLPLRSLERSSPPASGSRRPATTAAPGPLADAEQLIATFVGRYANPTTKANYQGILRALFLHADATHPGQLTEAAIVAYCVSGAPANNTVYCRRSAIRRFLAWCEAHAIPTGTPAHALSDSTSPLRTYKKTYGKVQGRHPGRWLTYDQAYRQLLAPCQDGTLLGLRDEIILRLGLLGLRANEIRTLTVGDVAQLPRITWTGKGRKPRRAVTGSSLTEALHCYVAQYRDPTPSSPLICPSRSASRQNRTIALQWHQPLAQRSLNHIVQQRAQQANLGHLAPHDLRRSAAGILHRTTDDGGAHRFDLLDIQQILGHSDPATTMRSYLEPINTAVLNRASSVLD
jgi:integrase